MILKKRLDSANYYLILLSIINFYSKSFNADVNLSDNISDIFDILPNALFITLSVVSVCVCNLTFIISSLG